MAAMTTARLGALGFGIVLTVALHATSADAARVRGSGGTPTIIGTPPTQVVAGSPYDFRPTASDPNGDRLVFRINKSPRWARFDSTTGRLYGTPSSIDVGRIRDIRITVTDGVYVASLPRFTLRVLQGGSPSISGTPSTSAAEGQAYSFQPTAKDPDGQALTFAVVNKPSWAAFDGATGRLSGTPPSGSAGTYASIVLSVTDGASTASLAPFAVTVAKAPLANRAPQISGTPSASVRVGETYVFTPSASDADRDALSFSVANAPSWLAFDAATGRLSGTAPAGSEGTYRDIVMSVTDGKEATVLAPFTITVATPAAVVPPPNVAPTISGTPPTSVTSGQVYSFTPTASDPDSSQVLRFGIANAPSWANFDIVTGRLSGTPTSAQAGTYAPIVISVSDGSLNASLPAFSITVIAANRAPTISGTPPKSVTAGQSYGFTPTASDPDGQALTFSIANKPSWSTFNTSTGQLSGTPAEASAGTYSGIVISVSDGTATASLPGFALTVQQVQLGSATIGWTPPTSNEDNSALTNLKGYRVYYGTSSSNLGQVVDIPSAGVSSVVIENLAPGTWYFGVRSYNTSNVESALSNLASKTLN